MKTIMSLLACLVLVVDAHAEDRLVTLLSTNVATYRDEMFQFRVTYSDLKVGKNAFAFTQTMIHTEELGSVKAVIKYNIPESVLKRSTYEVLSKSGVGKNTMVRITLPDATPTSVVSTTVETIDENGNKKTEKRGLELPQCDIYFPDDKSAKEWNDELTKRYSK